MIMNTEWWVHPREAVSQTIEVLRCSHDMAVATLVRRLLAKKITAVTGQYVGPSDPSNHLHGDWDAEAMVLWAGLWRYDVFRDPNSPLWFSGDVEAVVLGEQALFFNVRLQRADFLATLRDFTAAPFSENTPPSPQAAGIPAAPISTVDPKWSWEEALAALVAVADGIDGLQAIEKYNGPNKRGSQTAIENWLLTFFSSRDPNGNSPAASDARRRAKYVTSALQAAAMEKPKP